MNIDKDLETYGLEREFLEDIVKREKEVIKEEWKDTMTWEERAKIGMIDVNHVNVHIVRSHMIYNMFCARRLSERVCETTM